MSKPVRATDAMKDETMTRLRAAKKLQLVLDLDHTLVHATAQWVPPGLEARLPGLYMVAPPSPGACTLSPGHCNHRPTTCLLPARGHRVSAVHHQVAARLTEVFASGAFGAVDHHHLMRACVFVSVCLCLCLCLCVRTGGKT